MSADGETRERKGRLNIGRKKDFSKIEGRDISFLGKKI